MSKIAFPDVPGYAFHACNHPGEWPSHAIGCVNLPEDRLALWTIRMRHPERRSKLVRELEIALIEDTPAEILSSLNDALCQAFPDGLCIAEICVMVLDWSAHRLIATSAGDFLPVIRTPNDDIVELDRSKNGIPLGMLPSLDYSSQTIEIAATASVIWVSPYTTLIQNTSGRLYGTHDIPDRIRAAPREPALMVEHIVKDIEDFVGSSDQLEDISIMCFQRF